MTGSDVVIDGGESPTVYIEKGMLQLRLLTFLRSIARIYFVLNGEENSRVWKRVDWRRANMMSRLWSSDWVYLWYIWTRKGLETKDEM